MKRLLLALVFVVGSGTAFAYTAKITKADIVAAGGRCVGNLCSVNGKMYDCTAGSCTEIRMQ